MKDYIELIKTLGKTLGISNKSKGKNIVKRAVLDESCEYLYYLPGQLIEH